MNYATMDRAGRFVMPKKVREQLHLEEGARFKVEISGGRVEFIPDDEDNAELVQVNGLWVVRLKKGAKPRKGLGAVEAIKADREERDETIARRVRGLSK